MRRYAAKMVAKSFQFLAQHCGRDNQISITHGIDLRYFLIHEVKQFFCVAQ